MKKLLVLFCVFLLLFSTLYITASAKTYVVENTITLRAAVVAQAVAQAVRAAAREVQTEAEPTEQAF